MPTAWKANLVSLFIAQTCVMIAFSFVFPFIPLYVRDLGITDNAAAARWAGVIGAAAAITMAVAQPFWGSLADRHGRRIMVLRSIGAASITLGLMGLVHHPWQLLVLRFLQGAFTGTVAASNALVATSVPHARLGSSLGLMQVALYGGTSLGPLIGGFIADRLGYRVACFAAGGLMFAAFLLVVAFVRESFTPPPANVPCPGVLANSRRLLSVPGLLLVMGLSFLIQYGNTVVTPILALFINELANGMNAASTAGVILAGTGIASAIAAVLAGRIGDRFGHRRILPVCLLGAALSCVPQAFVHSPAELFALRIVLGLFLGGLMPGANALLAGLVPANRRGAAFGLGATAISLANAIGPLSGAFIGGALGLRSVFWATAVLYIVGLVFMLSRFQQLPSHARHTAQGIVPTDETE
ncbi:MAG: MFS transporter [Opitutaceae bacterium]|nr:MFS transporter [Opitutaceae bacterium]